jgi:hypothetical protein
MNHLRADCRARSLHQLEASLSCGQAAPLPLVGVLDRVGRDGFAQLGPGPVETVACAIRQSGVRSRPTPGVAASGAGARVGKELAVDPTDSCRFQSSAPGEPRFWASQTDGRRQPRADDRSDNRWSVQSGFGELRLL